MYTLTIPEEQWISYMDQFSRDHLGWSATIKVLDKNAGPQHVAENLPLQGISFDTKGSRPSSIEVSVGDQTSQHISHVVDMPLHIRQAEESNGAIDIEIEPARGPVTLIRMHGPVH
jgi:hypothetical protein